MNMERTRHLFALLVGIDTYPKGVGISDLRGCVNDVSLIKDYLENAVPLKWHIEILKNSEATRENIIRLFRDHLCRAGENDVVFFHYSGHGSTEVSATVFNPYFPDKQDETIVCYDSRCDGRYDLADKELAALLWEVAKNNPHIVVSLDCCHAGSGTREAGDSFLAAPRQTPAKTACKPRLLETYLDGFYSEPLAKAAKVSIPRVKHILLAACERGQRAWETMGHKGLFSYSLLETLEKSGPDIHYADLFVRSRATMFKRNTKQNPQFETYGRFMPYTRFLDGQPMAQKAPRYFVCFERGNWVMKGGALHGLATEAEKPVEVALYPESSPDSEPGKIAGYASAISIEAQTSTLKLKPDFQCGEEERFHAEIISLPAPPMHVLLEGDRKGKALVRKWQSQWQSECQAQCHNFTFTDHPAAKYVLDARGGCFKLRRVEKDKLIQAASGSPEPCLRYIFSVLEQVVRWERGLVLQNHNTRLNVKDVDFKLIELADDGEEFTHPGDFVNFDYTKKRVVPVLFRAHNQGNQTLHAVLLHFSRKYGISVLANEQLPAGKDPVTLVGENKTIAIGLPQGVHESIDTFKLIISTHRVDDFLLPQEDIILGMTLELYSDRLMHRRVKNTKHESDWFTKTITVKTVRQEKLNLC
jgi:hypothetical protein